jgi:predicted MFS family arabinose efflux permease
MAAAAGVRRGLALGAQTAAISVGQAAGSMLGGALFASLREGAPPRLGAAVILLALTLAVLTQINRGKRQRRKIQV